MNGVNNKRQGESPKGVSHTNPQRERGRSLSTLSLTLRVGVGGFAVFDGLREEKLVSTQFETDFNISPQSAREWMFRVGIPSEERHFLPVFRLFRRSARFACFLSSGCQLNSMSVCPRLNQGSVE